MDQIDYNQIISDQRVFFNSGTTLSLAFRLKQLQKLYKMLEVDLVLVLKEMSYGIGSL